MINNKKAASLTAEDFLSDAAIMLSIFIRDPQFQGQTKDKLTSAKASRLVEAAIKDSFDHWLSSDLENAAALLEYAIDRAELRKRKKEERFRFNGEETHNAEKIAQNRWFELPPSYLEKKRLFLIKQKHPWPNDEGPFMVNPREHGDIRCGSEGQTQDGSMLLLFSRNVVLSGVINSLQQKEKFTPLPPINELILENGYGEESAERKVFNNKISAKFKQLTENGRKLIKEIIADYRQLDRSYRD